MAASWCFRSCQWLNSARGALLAGWGGRRRADLEEFIRGFQIAYAENDMCTTWAEIRADSQKLGRVIKTQDAWVAATALAIDAPLRHQQPPGLPTHPPNPAAIIVIREVFMADELNRRSFLKAAAMAAGPGDDLGSRRE